MRRLTQGLANVVWGVLGLCARHVMVTGIIGWITWSMLTWENRVFLMISGSALVVGALMADARPLAARASSLADDLLFGYRKLRVRLLWTRIMKAAKAEELRTHPGQPSLLVPPKLRHHHFWQFWHVRDRIRKTPMGLQVTCDASDIGRSADSLQGAPAIAIAGKVKAISVAINDHPQRTWLTTIHFIYKDLLKRSISCDDLAISTEPAVVPIGKDNNMNTVMADLRLAWLIVGNLGSGKTLLAWVMIKNLLNRSLPFRLRVADPKGGMAFAPLMGKVHDYEATPTKLKAFLERAIDDLDTRMREMKSLGFDEWDPSNPDFPLDRFPLDVMIIDEVLSFVLFMGDEKIRIDGKEYSALDAFTLKYLSQIRAAGFTAILLSQLSQKSILGKIRDLCANKMCFRVGSVDIVRTMLEDAKAYPAHKIDKKYPGQGYINQGDGPQRIRTANITSEERDEVARQLGETRQKVGALS